MNNFREKGTSYNWENSKGDSISDLFSIDIKALGYDGFMFYQTGLIQKLLNAKVIEHCNGCTTHTKVDAPLGAVENGNEANRDWTNSYAYAIDMIPYLESNKRLYITFFVHQYAHFTHNTKELHEMVVHRICRYFQGTKDKSLVFNPSKIWWCIVMLMYIWETVETWKLSGIYLY